MRIWKKPISVDILTESHRRTAPELVGMEFVEVGDDFIVARIPVDERTRQPYGLLHGGVSVVLAETLGSCGAYYSCPPEDRAVGLDINANHIKGVKSGWVRGITRAAILKLVEAEGIELEERAFSVEEAKRAREVFVTAASSFVMPITSLD
jgi:uncharacterized protein (TIGR00369 family)